MNVDADSEQIKCQIRARRALKSDCFAFSLQQIALMRRQKRLSVDSISIKNEVLSVSHGHVTHSDVTGVLVVDCSRWMCRTFLATVQKVGCCLLGTSHARVQFHVKTTRASVKPTVTAVFKDVTVANIGQRKAWVHSTNTSHLHVRDWMRSRLASHRVRHPGWVTGQWFRYSVPSVVIAHSSYSKLLRSRTFSDH